jgi:hypothetical protein
MQKLGLERKWMMSNKILRHADICKELNQIAADKDHDYGNSTSATYQKFGIVSYLTRLYDKLSRASVLAQNGGDAKVTDEKLEDTLLDMANYCIFAVDDLRQEQKEKNGGNTSITTATYSFCDNCQNFKTRFCEQCITTATDYYPSNYCPNN